MDATEEYGSGMLPDYFRKVGFEAESALHCVFLLVYECVEAAVDFASRRGELMTAGALTRDGAHLLEKVRRRRRAL